MNSRRWQNGIESEEISENPRGGASLSSRLRLNLPGALAFVSATEGKIYDFTRARKLELPPTRLKLIADLFITPEL